nr:DUF1043 family protein [Halomonas cerina]
MAGIGIGALGYHLLHTGAGTQQKLRQRLAERDRELVDIKDGMGDRLERLTQLAESLRRESQRLEEEVEAASGTLGAPSLRRQAMDLVSRGETPSDEDAVAVPRDYADGNRGTLSEDYGLRHQEAASSQPLRH